MNFGVGKYGAERHDGGLKCPYWFFQDLVVYIMVDANFDGRTLCGPSVVYTLTDAIWTGLLDWPFGP